MNRTDVLRRIAAVSRRDWTCGLFALGYLSHDASTETLEALLTALEERQELPDSPDHLAAYRERWGRVPDAQ
jgi:hypothetical protein